MSITVNADYLPLYVVTHDGQVSDEEFDRYLEKVTRSMYEPQSSRRILIQDATKSGPSPATQRRRQAEWLKDHEKRLRELTIAIVFVIPSSFVRGVLTAILWLQPLPVPHHVCSSLSEALEWAEKRLEQEGLKAPTNARGALLVKAQGAF